MALKRALVVDDSKSARVALQRLLEQHDIEVSFAESGEEAIDFLKHQAVDVIFMDHSMPGMDGLETVSVIKADPRTAMIPVMMYTAKEGEVYVGQARALGAIDVLPKQVQPGVLFEMLLKLGLVKERRAGTRRRSGDGARARAAAPAEDQTELLLERQALGMSIQALITRILQDQHLELRSDVLASNRDFAKRVAEEIHAKQQAEAELAQAEPARRTGPAGLGIGLGLLLGLLPALVLYVFYAQAAGERDAAIAENAELSAAVQQQSTLLESLRTELSANRDDEQSTADSRYLAVVDALQWAANQGNHFPYGEIPFGDARVEPLAELLERLAAIGFTGTVQLDAHLGEFCLGDDGAGGYRLAEPERAVTECDLLGHPLGGSGSLRERLSVGFANFIGTSPLLNDTGITVRLIAHGSRDSTRRYAYPLDLRTAGEWNRIAELNNRVEYTLIPQ
jgi:CheY-like chemotaxis protein